MTDVKRLLAEATPLPWTHGRTNWRRQRTDWWGIFPPRPVGTLPMFSLPPKPVAYLEDEQLDHADAALIVYAVNRLPAFEATVEALQRIVDRGCGTGALRDARAALARLREAVPA